MFDAIQYNQIAYLYGRGFVAIKASQISFDWWIITTSYARGKGFYALTNTNHSLKTSTRGIVILNFTIYEHPLRQICH